MDTVSSINILRAQFLRICPEKDQMSRLMKPYIPIDGEEAVLNYGSDTFDNVDSKIADIYKNPDGTSILGELESPPISKNFMDSYATIAKARMKKNAEERNYVSRSDTMRFGHEKLEETEIPEVSNIAAKDGKFSTPERDNQLIDNANINDHDNHTMKRDSISTSILTDELNDNTVYDHPTDKKKENKKSGLPFVRIFKSKRDGSSSDSRKQGHTGSSSGKKNNATSNSRSSSNNNNNNNHNNINGNNLSVSNKSSRTFENSSRKSPQTLKVNQGHVRRRSKYSMNFDYDENLDEEEEDEDEDEEGADIHSKFFRLESGSTNASESHSKAEHISSKNASIANGNGSRLLNSAQFYNNNGNSSNAGTTNSKHGNEKANNQGINKSKQNGGQSVAQKGGPLELGKSLSSINGSVLTTDPTVESKAAKSVSGNELKSLHGDDDVISDIDSFIEAQNLEEIDFDTENNGLNKIISDESNRDIPSINEIDTERTSLAADDVSSSDASSYGKSLLGSDYSADDLIKPDVSSLDSNSIIGPVEMQTHTIPSNSIPMSLTGYGLYHGADESTINNVFNKAVQNLKNPASSSGKKERLPSAFYDSTANSTTNNGFLDNGVMSKSKTAHVRSVSNSSDPTKYNKYDNRQFKRESTGQKCNSNTNSSTDQLMKTKRMDGLQIEKKTDFEAPRDAKSQLSYLFQKKKQNAGNPLNALDYFSFVSGSKVQKSDSMALEVYIQSSKKYKKVPFSIDVRKSSTVFEVIGYILYSYCNDFKPPNFDEDGIGSPKASDPNAFSLSIVDEDGEPFEDNFGRLDRKSEIQTVSDNEVVLCDVSEQERKSNIQSTPLPYDINGDVIDGMQSGGISRSSSISKSEKINQLSFYKPIVQSTEDLENTDGTKTIPVTVYLYPNLNPKFNFTIITVNVTSKINDILVKYCKMKNLDPNEYLLKVADKMETYDLNDTVLKLDGSTAVELISKKEAREKKMEKLKADPTIPVLPTIQSSDTTPLTLEPSTSYFKAKPDEKYKSMKSGSKSKKGSSKYKLGLAKQSSFTSSNSVGAGAGTGSNHNSNSSGGNIIANGTSTLFKSKNSSKSSLHGPLQFYHLNRSQSNMDNRASYSKSVGTSDISTSNVGANNFQDLFSGAYHRYRVWRRQQMSFINKHERTLALDGDYIYIVPPEGRMHWHENIKTKSLHISQVVLVKKSKSAPENFKIYVRRGHDDIKRYYFEASSPQECTEIVTRLQNLMSAYKMNVK
ncbi:Avo1p [Nakaseomyces bracarensis]|uniref:Avo1p n=1 Tax=Nakaseomyces bracarensis TaxID=273131 RepID=UPI003871086F